MPGDIKVQAAVGDDIVAPPVATDRIAGRDFQKIKAGWGVAGVFQETADTDGLRIPIGGAQVGAINETAPVSDIANAGLNGRLQRIAQRLTALIAQVPATLGQKTMANSLAVTLASDQPAQAVTGTFWQATQPVSGTVTANAGTNTSTAALGAATAIDLGDEAATDEAVAGAAAGLRFMGFSARETTGSAGAIFNIRHGTTNAAGILVTVSLAAGESAREWYGPDGLVATSGIWLERASGQIQVSGYSKVVT